MKPSRQPSGQGEKMKKFTKLEEAELLQTRFESWWKKATAKGARYLVDFGCQHAYKAGYARALRVTRKPRSPK